MIDDSRTSLDVNALSSSQRGAAYVSGCKITAFFCFGKQICRKSYKNINIPPYPASIPKREKSQ